METSVFKPRFLILVRCDLFPHPRWITAGNSNWAAETLSCICFRSEIRSRGPSDDTTSLLRKSRILSFASPGNPAKDTTAWATSFAGELPVPAFRIPVRFFCRSAAKHFIPFTALDLIKPLWGHTRKLTLEFYLHGLVRGEILGSQCRLAVGGRCNVVRKMRRARRKFDGHQNAWIILNCGSRVPHSDGGLAAVNDLEITDYQLVSFQPIGFAKCSDAIVEQVKPAAVNSVQECALNSGIDLIAQRAAGVEAENAVAVLGEHIYDLLHGQCHRQGAVVLGLFRFGGTTPAQG